VKIFQKFRILFEWHQIGCTNIW